MNDRGRILALLRGEQPDRVPWFGELAYWAYARGWLRLAVDKAKGVAFVNG